MRKSWFFLMGLATAGAVLAQTPPPKPGEGDPKAPQRVVSPKKEPEAPGPRTGPAQSGSPDSNKTAPAPEAGKQDK